MEPPGESTAQGSRVETGRAQVLLLGAALCAPPPKPMILALTGSSTRVGYRTGVGEVPDGVTALHCGVRGKGGVTTETLSILADPPKALPPIFTGRLLKEMAVAESDYLSWIINNDFSEQVKQIVQAAMRNPGSDQTFEDWVLEEQQINTNEELEEDAGNEGLPF